MYLPHGTTVRIRTCVKSLAQRMAGHLVDSRREDSRPLWRGTSARLLMAPYVKGSFLGQGRVPFLEKPSFKEGSMWGANSAPIVPSRVISRVHVHLRSRDLRRRCRGLASPSRPVSSALPQAPFPNLSPFLHASLRLRQPRL